ncbi:hypothetical protein CR513_13578, partial [Mucuna pruriens]
MWEWDFRWTREWFEWEKLMVQELMQLISIAKPKEGIEDDVPLLSNVAAFGWKLNLDMIQTKKDVNIQNHDFSCTLCHIEEETTSYLIFLHAFFFYLETMLWVTWKSNGATTRA